MTAAEDDTSSIENTRERALQGDPQAFEAIYNRYAGRIRAFAIARGADDADAITNDVMLRAFRNLSTFTGDEGQFVRWIFTIARNRLIDAHRAQQRRPQIVDTPVPDRVEPSAEVSALAEMSTERVADLLGSLTVDQREVVALRMVDDLSLRDVAAIVDRPVTAVKALQRRGLKALQKQIFDEGVS